MVPPRPAPPAPGCDLGGRAAAAEGQRPWHAPAFLWPWRQGWGVGSPPAPTSHCCPSCPPTGLRMSAAAFVCIRASVAHLGSSGRLGLGAEASRAGEGPGRPRFLVEAPPKGGCAAFQVGLDPSGRAGHCLLPLHLENHPPPHVQGEGPSGWWGRSADEGTGSLGVSPLPASRAALPRAFHSEPGPVWAVWSWLIRPSGHPPGDGAYKDQCRVVSRRGGSVCDRWPREHPGGRAEQGRLLAGEVNRGGKTR